MKFGGTSVADSDAVESVARLIRTRLAAGHQVVVVVSAMGGVTDALASSACLATKGAANSAAQSLQETFQRHFQVAERLLSASRLTPYTATLVSSRAETDALLHLIARAEADQVPSLLDRLLSYGEQLSALLLASVLCEGGLRSNYVDARRCIVTDAVHGGAAPLLSQTMLMTKQELGPKIEMGWVPVLGGFIGAARNGAPTTLGRNGSDYTAALVGLAVCASEIQIWTDVAGVLTADPRLVSDACTIDHLSYSEAAELAYFGAKVVYPKAIQCAAEQQIPLRICSSRTPDDGSTTISSARSITPGIFKSIARKTGLVLMRLISNHSLLTTHRFLSNLFESFAQHRGSIDLVDISEQSVSIVLSEDGAYAMREALRELGTVEILTGRALICIIGEGLGDTPGSATRVFGALGDIRIDLISHGRHRSSLVFLVAEEESSDVVQRLHQHLFRHDEDEYCDIDGLAPIAAHPNAADLSPQSRSDAWHAEG